MTGCGRDLFRAALLHDGLLFFLGKFGNLGGSADGCPWAQARTASLHIAAMPSGDMKGPRVMRLPGEPLEAVEKRATELMLDVRVFFLMYRGLND